MRDAIGGDLLDDPLTGTCGSGRFEVYLDQNRWDGGLPPDDRAAVLLARLGRTGREVLAGVRGDALVVGIDVRGGDGDVPVGVLAAVCRAEQRVTVTVDPDLPLHPGTAGHTP